MEKVINLTPHDIVVQDSNGGSTTFPASGNVARVASTPGELVRYAASDVPVYGYPVYGPVEGLPDPKDGIMYIVSLLSLSQCSGRDDVVSPGTGPYDGAIRNEKGEVVAVTRFIAAPPKLA